MDIISAYHEVGTYRGAADICGTTHKTVRRVMERAEAGDAPRSAPAVRVRNYDEVTDLVAQRVRKSEGPDVGEAVAADRRCCRVPRVAEELPPVGGGAESVVAQGSSPWTAASGVGAG